MTVCLYKKQIKEIPLPLLTRMITLPSRQLICWEFSIHNSVILATTFIKNGPNFTPSRLFQAPYLLKSRNQIVQLPITLLFQPPHHSKLECFWFSQKSVKIKLLNAWLCTQKNKSFKCGIVINCFGKHLLPVVYMTE